MIKQIIPVQGAWFVMLRDEEDPESCHPVRIAAWALTDEESEKSEIGECVYPLIPQTDWGWKNQLVIPPEENVVAIVDEEGSRDPNWQEMAKSQHEEETREDDKKELESKAISASGAAVALTPPRAVSVVSILDARKGVTRGQEMAMKLLRTFFYPEPNNERDPGDIQLCTELGLIEIHHGSSKDLMSGKWVLTKLGDEVWRRLSK